MCSATCEQAHTIRRAGTGVFRAKSTDPELLIPARRQEAAIGRGGIDGCRQFAMLGKSIAVVE
jgi:hypothetical protein